VSLRFGVHFSGCGVGAFTALFVYLSSYCQRTAEDGLRRILGSVSGDGRSSRCCTVGELLRDCDLVSVMAVQEKCDESLLCGVYCGMDSTYENHSNRAG
jgi:hypothetical protein